MLVYTQYGNLEVGPKSGHESPCFTQPVCMEPRGTFMCQLPGSYVLTLACHMKSGVEFSTCRIMSVLRKLQILL